MAAPAGAGPGIYGLGLPFGYGRVRQIPLSLPRPAVTAGYTYPVGGAYLERLVCASVSLVSDGTAGNRAVLLALEDGDGNVLLEIPPAGVQAASLTVRYSWSVHVSQGAAAVDGAQLMQIPPLILQAGWQWVWTIDAPQAGDRFAAQLFGLREQFPTGDLGYATGLLPAAAPE